MSNNLPNIVVSPQNVQGYCDLKCSYDFNYNETNLTASNRGEMISVTPEKSSDAPVVYNKKKYNVDKIFIYSPSIHYFNNATQAVGEIVIMHSSITGGNNLAVGIPFMESSEITNATNLITDIIETVAASAPAEGDSVNLNMTDFTLQSIVPKKPFFNYISKNDRVEWIVYGTINAIPIGPAVLGTLQNLIKPFNIPTTGGDLFFNSKGPNTVGVGDGIYISCQPTGSSDEEIPVTYNTNNTSYDLFNNSAVILVIQILVGLIMFIIVFLILNYCYHFLISDPSQMLAHFVSKKNVN